ncbi:MAG: DUF4157 domain-containing protein [Paludibacteraceae bacterium]|nr:DUF4157 domain-containing protein [Paludibacteraceae bacterium]
METQNQHLAKASHHVSSSLGRGAVARPSQSQTVIQAQLETTTPGDAYEQEAENTANLVMRQLSQGGDSVNPTSLHRSVPTISCSGGNPVGISSQMESQLSTMQGGGHAMPSGLRSQMEGSFGRDFSNVRLHTDTNAVVMSSSLQANAFTHGNDIYFNQGQYQPNSSKGQHLIAHELTHTVQQSGKVGRFATFEEASDHNFKDGITKTPAYFGETTITDKKQKKIVLNAQWYALKILKKCISVLNNSTENSLCKKIFFGDNADLLKKHKQLVIDNFEKILNAIKYKKVNFVNTNKIDEIAHCLSGNIDGITEDGRIEIALDILPKHDFYALPLIEQAMTIIHELSHEVVYTNDNKTKYPELYSDSDKYSCFCDSGTCVLNRIKDNLNDVESLSECVKDDPDFVDHALNNTSSYEAFARNIAQKYFEKK